MKLKTSSIPNFTLPTDLFESAKIDRTQVADTINCMTKSETIITFISICTEIVELNTFSFIYCIENFVH